MGCCGEMAASSASEMMAKEFSGDADGAVEVAAASASDSRNAARQTRA